MLSFYMSIIDTEDQRSLLSDLYCDYKDYMFHIANNILKDTYSAESAVHETFLRIIENMDKYTLTCRHKTKGLLGLIVSSIAIDQYRHKNRLNLQDNFTDVPAYGLSVEEQAISTEQYDCLLESIHSLDNVYADVIKLKYLFNLSNKEISETLLITEAAVRQRLSRGRKKLRERLVEEGVSLD